MHCTKIIITNLSINEKCEIEKTEVKIESPSLDIHRRMTMRKNLISEKMNAWEENIKLSSSVSDVSSKF